MSWDEGLFKPACIGDYIWDDCNANGIQDEGEEPLEGVEVTLVPLEDEFGNKYSKDLDGNTLGTIKTDENGKYKFCQLVPGKYQVKVTTPDEYYVTREDVNSTDDTKDSDIDGFLKQGTLPMPEETLVSDEKNMTFDGGVFKPVCIGDAVWLDKNADGIQDEGEPGIANVTITLLTENGDSNITDVNGNLVEPIVTGEDGAYKFCNLIPGTYKVKFEAAADENGAPYITTVKDGDSVLESNIPNGGVSEPITVGCDENKDYTNIKAGFIQEICLGDYVWYDENLNGVQDEKNLGVIDVTVHLQDAKGNAVKDVYGNVVKATKTDKKGYYKFCHLAPSKDYVIKFDIPESYLATKRNQGSDLKDSDADSTGKIFVKAPVKDDMTLDLGIYCECDDWEVNPQNYEEVKAPSINFAGALAILTVLILMVRRRD